jgi:hypothetical protein
VRYNRWASACNALQADDQCSSVPIAQDYNSRSGSSFYVAMFIGKSAGIFATSPAALLQLKLDVQACRGQAE